MSIPNIFNKIKSKFDIDKFTFMYFCIIVLVGFSSFGLGRLSVKSDISSSNQIITQKVEQTNVKPKELNESILIKKNELLPEFKNRELEQEKKFVASKNGKLYYSLGCKAANRIKPENEVWFRSESDAIKSGYSASTSCK